MADQRNLRVLVFGGRNYSDRAAVYEALDRLNAKYGIAWIISGGARGADTLAEDWARLRKISRTIIPISNEHWESLGKAAGPMRNTSLLGERPDVGVQFPGGGGTMNMRTQCDDAQVSCWEPVKHE